MNNISVIIPAYNEEELLEGTVLEAIQTVSELSVEFEIIIINDGSTDKTGRLADELADKYQFISVIHHQKNRGLGQALSSGYEKANNELITWLPADGQINPHNIQLFLNAISEVDFVTSYQKDNREKPVHRKMLSWGLRSIERWLFGSLPRSELSRMFRRKILSQITIHSKTLMANRELLVKAYKLGYKFKEIEVEVRPRKAGKSKVANLSKVMIVLIEMIKLRLSADYRQMIR